MGIGRWGQRASWCPLLPPDASRSLPDFSELDLQGKVLPEGVEPGDIKAFQVLYREHCEVGQPGGRAGVREGHAAR